MKKETRREKILDYLNNSKSVKSDELSRIFNVTEETIRKDLTYLSENGMIIRTFGGAAVKEENDLPLVQRTIHNYSQKQKIALEASKLINDRDLIVMDSGSTNVVLAQCLRPNSEIVIVTNSLEIMNILANIEGITAISTGGKLRVKSMSFQGINAERSVSFYNIEKAFISCSAVDIAKGVMDGNESEATIKSGMIKAAKEVYLLADSSKFSRMAHITTCQLDRLTAIITDDLIDPELVKQYENRGIKIIIGK